MWMHSRYGLGIQVTMILIVLICNQPLMVSGVDSGSESVNESLMLSKIGEFCRWQDIPVPDEIDSLDADCYQGRCTYHARCSQRKDFRLNDDLEITAYDDGFAPDYSYLEIELAPSELADLARGTGLVPEDAVYWRTEARRGYCTRWRHYVQGIPVLYDNLCVIIDPEVGTINGYNREWAKVSKRPITEYDMIPVGEATEIARGFLSSDYEGFEDDPIIAVQRLVFAPRVFVVGRDDRNETRTDHPLCYEVAYCPRQYAGDHCVWIWVGVESGEVVGTGAIWGEPDPDECLSYVLQSEDFLFVSRQIQELLGRLDAGNEEIALLRNLTAEQKEEIERFKTGDQENEWAWDIALLMVVVVLFAASAFLIRRRDTSAQRRGEND